MAFIHGKGSQVLLNQRNLSPYLQVADVVQEIETHDVTCLPDDSVARFSGLFDGKAALSGLFDDSLDAWLHGFIGDTSGRAFTLVLGTPAAGSRVRIGTVRRPLPSCPGTRFRPRVGNRGTIGRPLRHVRAAAARLRGAIGCPEPLALPPGDHPVLRAVGSPNAEVRPVMTGIVPEMTVLVEEPCTVG